MQRKIPFVWRVFWKVLVVVAVLGAAAWALIVKLTEYRIQPQDYGGSVISGVLLAYLVHLWLLPQEDPPPDSK
jgi:hypothetical protein